MDASLQMQAYKKMLYDISDLLQRDLDIALYLTDTEKCLEYIPGRTIDAKVREGDIIREDEPVYDVIHNRNYMDDIVPPEVFGFAFRGIGKPLTDDEGNVIGALAIARNIERERQIADASMSVFSSLEQISASTQELSAMSVHFSDYITKISALSEKTSSAINEADSILHSIQAISTQSNLLALNAAIEAARAGAEGKSFAVVAKEMKKLSDTSNRSANNVSEMLNEMKDSIDNISGQISKLLNSSGVQMAAASQIAASVEEVTSASQKLVGLSKE